jgi:membrane-associated phospholipid phosphatase
MNIVLKKILICGSFLSMGTSTYAFDWRGFFHRSVHHAVDFNKACFSMPAACALLATAPYYVVARQMDNNLNDYFCCPDHHQNNHQFPENFYTVCDKSVFAVCLGLGTMAFLPVRLEWQRAAEVYLVALPFTWLGKNLFKLFVYDGNLRPKSGNFDWRKPWYGANPSGHLVNTVFTAVFWGMVGGPIFAIPLTLFSALLGVNFIVGNRHYVSQLVAGVGVGALFGYASYWAWKQDLKCLNAGFDLGFCQYPDGSKGIRCGVSW